VQDASYNGQPIVPEALKTTVGASISRETAIGSWLTAKHHSAMEKVMEM